MRSARNDADIRSRDRAVILDQDLQRCIGGIAVAIDHSDEEIAVLGQAQQIVSQRVAEADLARIQIDAGDGERAEGSDEFLADSGDFHAVQDDCRKPVRRTEDDRAGGGFGTGFVCCALRLVSARGQAAFSHRGDGVFDADRVVRRLDHHIGIFVLKGNDFLFRLRLEGQFGIGKKVTKIECVLQEQVAIVKTPARAGRRVWQRIGVEAFIVRRHRQAVEGSRNRHRRDRNAIDHYLGRVDRAIGDQNGRSIGQRDHQIAALDREIVKRGSSRKVHDAIGISNHNSGSSRDVCGRFLILVRAVQKSIVEALVTFETTALATFKINHCKTPLR